MGTYSLFATVVYFYIPNRPRSFQLFLSVFLSEYSQATVVSLKLRSTVMVYRGRVCPERFAFLAGISGIE